MVMIGKLLNLAAKAMLVNVANFIRLFSGCKQISSRCDCEEHLCVTDAQRVKCKDEAMEHMINTLVIITISCRGSLSSLIAFPRITSDTPLEYT